MAIYTRYSWCKDWLVYLGNRTPSANIIKFVEAWAAEEGGGFTNTCSYNLLNTMRFVPNCYDCNTAGVKAYQTYVDGLYGNKLAIENGLYPHLYTALLRNNEQALGLLDSDMAEPVKEDLSVWVSGQRTPIATGYINNILSIYRSL